MVDNLKLFDQSATTFNSNGLGFLSEATKCVVEEERNGIFELELEYPMTGRRFTDIQLRNIIIAKPNPYDDPQPFRIYQISKPIKGVITVNARHISYDLSDWVCLPFLTFDSKGAGRTVEGDYFPSLMTRLQSNSVTYGSIYDPDRNFPFHFDTDMQLAFLWEPDPATGKYKDGDDHRFKFFKPASVRSILGDSKECGVLGKFIDPNTKQRCELKYDGYYIHILAQRGSERGFEIRYGKNMTDLDHSEVADKDYTDIFPFWKSVNSEDTAVAVLGGADDDPTKPPYVPIVEKSYHKFLVRDLSSDFEEPPDADSMRKYAAEYIKDEELKGIPTTNITVNFQELSKSSEYARYKDLERVQLCDLVKIVHEGLGITDEKKVIKTTYDAITDQYTSIDLGDPRDELATTVSKNISITNNYGDTTNIINEQGAADMLKQLTTIYYLKTNNDPVPTPSIIVVDTDETKENTWIAVEPVAQHNGTLYTAQQKILSAGEATWSDVSLSKVVNTVKSLIDTDETTGVNTLAGDKLTSESVGSAAITTSAVVTSKIDDHAVTYDKIAVDAIHSGNYKEIPDWSSSKSYSYGDYVIYNGTAYECTSSTSGAWDPSKWSELPTDLFSDEGTFFDLSNNGVLQSRNFAIDSDGTVYLRGDIYAHGGNLGGWSITNEGLVYEGTVGQNRIDFSPSGDLYASGTKPYIDATGALVMRISVNSAGVDPQYRAVFAIGKDGKVYATKGEIAGWKVENDTFIHESTGENPDVYLFGTTSSANKFEAGSPIGETIAASSAVTNLVLRVGDKDNATFAIDENGAIYAMEGHIGSLILDGNGLSYIGEDQVEETETVIGFKDYGVAIEDKKGYSTSLYSSRFYALKSGTNLYNVFGPGHPNLPIPSMRIAAEIADSDGNTIAALRLQDPEGELSGHWVFYDKHRNYDQWVSGESYVKGDKVSYRASSSEDWQNYRLNRDTYDFVSWLPQYWDPIPPESLDGVYLNDDLTLTLEQRLQQLKDQVISYLPPVATSSTVGVVKIGTGLSITESGLLSADTFTLQPATSTTLGGVKVGGTLAVSADGTLNMGTHRIPYGVCSTASGTSAKTVSVSADLTSADLTDGLTVIVKMTNASGVSSATLNVNGMGAKYMYVRGTTKTGTTSGTVGWAAGELLICTYDSAGSDGGGWIINKGFSTDTNTNTIMRTYRRNKDADYPLLAGTTCTASTGGWTWPTTVNSYVSAYGMVATSETTPTFNPSTGKVTIHGNLAVASALTVNNTSVSLAGHTHSAADITSGEIDPSRLPDLSETYSVIGHTHLTTITTTNATVDVELNHGQRYTLSAGGTSQIFKMPDSPILAPPSDSPGMTLVADEDGTYDWAYLKFSDLTSTPTTISGYGITDAASSGHTHSTYATTFSISDHTITLKNGSTTLSSITVPDNDTKYYAGTALTLTSSNSNWYFNVVTETGGGITTGETGLVLDTNTTKTLLGLGTAAYSAASSFASSTHTHTFASLTSKPTTLSGYGITDAASSGHTHSVFSTETDGFVPGPAPDETGFLKADGTWATPQNTSYSFQTGSTSGKFQVRASNASSWTDVGIYGLGSAAYGTNSPITITNTSAQAAGNRFYGINVYASSAYAGGSNVSNGNIIGFQVGKENSTRNVGYLGFHYWGTSGSSSNCLTLGLNGADHVITANGFKRVGINTLSPDTELHVVHTSTTSGGAVVTAETKFTGGSAWASGYYFRMPNAVNNSNMALLDGGVSGSKNNTASFQFHYIASGSSANYASYSLFGNDDIIVYNGYRRVGINTVSPAYDLDVVGTINASSNIRVNGTAVSLEGHTHSTYATTFSISDHTITLKNGSTTLSSITVPDNDTKYYAGTALALTSSNSNWYFNVVTETGGGITTGETGLVLDTNTTKTLLGLGTAAYSAASSFASSTHTHTFASLTSKPTTLSGYGITDAASSGHTHSTYATTFSISDHTITLKNGSTTLSSITVPDNDTKYYAGTALTLTSSNSNWYFNVVTETGGGITTGETGLVLDTNTTKTLLGLGTAAYSAASSFASSTHTHTFASLTSKPTTLSGYGITDAASSGHTHSTYATTFSISDHTITLKNGSTTLSSITVPDNDTKYYAGTALTLTSSNSNWYFNIVTETGGGITTGETGLVLDTNTTKTLLGLGTAAYTSSTAYATSGHNHDTSYVPFKGKNSGNAAQIVRYNSLSQRYEGGVNNHFMVTIPATTAWIQFSIELSLHDYNSTNYRYSKLLITGGHNATSPYSLLKLTATLIGNSAGYVPNLSGISVNGKTDTSGKIYLYIVGDTNYKTLSVDNMLVADGIINTDISAVSISNYTDLPSDTIAATMQYNYNPMTSAYDMIVGGTNGAPTRLAKGSNGTFLGINSSGFISWMTASGTTYTFANGTGDTHGFGVTPSGGSQQRVLVSTLHPNQDTRGNATTPNDYNGYDNSKGVFAFKGLKENSAIGSPSSDNYSYLLGLRGWSDSSGGGAWELGFNDTGIFARTGGAPGAGNTWGSWTRLVTTRMSDSKQEPHTLIITKTGNQSSSTWVHLYGGYMPNAYAAGATSTAGNIVGYEVGVSSTARNCGYLGFHYWGPSSSSSNCLTLGLHSADHLITANGYKRVGINTIAPTATLDISQDSPSTQIPAVRAYTNYTAGAAGWGVGYLFQMPSAANSSNMSLLEGGVNNSKNNQASFQFHYISSTSSSNYASYSLCQNDDILVYNGYRRVGINTTSPAYTLDVNGTLRTASGIYFGTSTTSFTGFNTASGLSLNSQGKVGIELASNSGLTFDSDSNDGLKVILGTASTVAAAGNHTHGYIQNNGSLPSSASATAATGDAIVIVDSSDSSKISYIKDLLNSTHGGAFLRRDGTWAVPPATSGVTAIKQNNGTGTEYTNVKLTFSGATINMANNVVLVTIDGTCLMEGTKILMADRTEKNVEDVVEGDLIMSYDPNTGEMCEAIVIANLGTGVSDDFVNYYFDDGSFVTIFGKHCLYNSDMGTARGVDFWEPGWKCINSSGEEITYIGSEDITHVGRKRHFDLRSSNMLYFANGVLNANALTANNMLVKRSGFEFPQSYLDAIQEDADSSARLNAFKFDRSVGSKLVPILKEMKRQKKLMDENKKYLADTDYIVAKFTEGLIGAAEWLKAKTDRAGWRTLVNKAEEAYNTAKARYDAFKDQYKPKSTHRERFNAAVARDNACLEDLKAHYAKQRKNQNEEEK